MQISWNVRKSPEDSPKFWRKKSNLSFISFKFSRLLCLIRNIKGSYNLYDRIQSSCHKYHESQKKKKEDKFEMLSAHIAPSMMSRLHWLFCFPPTRRTEEAENVDLYDTRASRSPRAIVPYGGLFHVGWSRVGPGGCH